MESFDLCVGDKLWYINKFSGELEAVYVMLVEGEFFSVTYKGKPYILPLYAIGTRLFLDMGDAWLSWYEKHLPEPEKEVQKKSIKKRAKPNPATKVSSVKELSDVLLRCAECGRKFVWTVGEQEFYREKGYTRPRTCSRECRERRNQTRVRNEWRRELHDAMQPSEPYRTGSNAKNPIHVSGGVVAEISEWTEECMEKGYTNIF